MPSVYTDFPLVVFVAGMIAALIVWALPRRNEWAGFVLITAGVALFMVSIVLAFLT
jgi:hypothetical protein